MNYELQPNGNGWAVRLPELPFALQATGGVSERGSVRAVVELWRLNGEAPSLLFADEGVLTKEKDRERLAEAMSKAAGKDIPTGALLALVQAIKTAPPEDETEDTDEGEQLGLEDTTPWEEPVDGAAVLDEVEATFRRHAVLPDGGPEALALWVLHTYAFDSFEVSPKLSIVSPTHRCGKSTVLDLLDALVYRPVSTVNISAAALYRLIAAYRPTVLIDEADAFMGDNEELRGIINAAHTRAKAYVARVEEIGGRREVKFFSTWAPLAIARIGRLPSTVADRSVIIPMRRKAKDEKVERFRRDRIRDQLAPLRHKMARWAADNMEALRDLDPAVPEELNDRAQDNWRPLLAIADLAGGDWPEKARRAARLLSGVAEDEDEEVGPLLLADIYSIFEKHKKPQLASATIVEELCDLDDRPWAEFRRGQPLSTHTLARLLKSFGVKPKNVRLEGGVKKGYVRDDFADAWRRYPPPGTEGDFKPLHPLQPHNDGQNGDSANRYNTPSVAFRGEAANPHHDGIVAGVADRKPDPVEEDETEYF